MYKEKLEYLLQVAKQVRDVQTAARFALKNGDLRPLRDGAEALVLFPEGTIVFTQDASKRGKKGKTFSKVYQEMSGFDPSYDLGSVMLRDDAEGLTNEPSKGALPNRKFHLIPDKRMLQDDFEFSDEVTQFSLEMRNAVLLFAESKGEDQQIDLLVMRALFHAGRILGHLKAKGRKESDQQGARGSQPKGDRYSDDELQEAFDNSNAKNAHAMWLEIDRYLNDHKKQTKDKRAIPSKSTILRWLRESGLDKQLPK